MSHRFIPAERSFHPYDPRRALGRLIVAVALGTFSFAVAPERLGLPVRVGLAWNVATSALLVLVWLIIGRSSTRQTRHRAALSDPGRTAAWVLVLSSSLFALIAATFVLREAKSLAPDEADMLVVLSLWAVGAGWVLTHSIQTLRYAHLYYRDHGEGEGGIEFPGNKPPDTLDFAYFAFTIGMCFQTSDVTVSSRIIRRTVLLHAVISFLYNTAILAVALNLVFGRLA